MHSPGHSRAAQVLRPAALPRHRAAGQSSMVTLRTTTPTFVFGACLPPWRLAVLAEISGYFCSVIALGMNGCTGPPSCSTWPPSCTRASSGSWRLPFDRAARSAARRHCTAVRGCGAVDPGCDARTRDRVSAHPATGHQAGVSMQPSIGGFPRSRAYRCQSSPTKGGAITRHCQALSEDSE